MDSDINTRIAARLRGLRAARGLTLDTLATRCGVSRSMISLIERGETSATAVVLERIAAGLGVALASLFEPTEATADPVSRRSDQAVWQDPASGYVRRNVSPASPLTPIQIVEVTFPAGAHVTYDHVTYDHAASGTGGRAAPLHHQVWVLEGAIEVTVGDASHALDSGDCLAFTLDRPTAYRNPHKHPARYAVVIVGSAGAWSKP
ncbi:helix-turn-helix domain-containing protein [Bradyrhizobium sp. U87765 SZCCT0131]|uniref:helix-turn-helix domain-containing protein n=1 Tax=unclassified Bradyrhizobium TaxID=2631580 RepID=UPI001BAD5963|nr:MULTISPECIES: helix-turn-helix domain-containing protein [unclassified Bradyrhizobium]MBR1216763.1 helix-turn-helix domain-containing protein [Bradyrhizobium sp. U87765 SZCCT0131]MBR1259481.1 helix-turn-helix domain-containing protein [Bradyrhizobium sp. U87765 SZCCT0134]MBR1305622.1 helix-turn-helix domain-containing protein [Bradyrhizobium sp. U87765 SZCCT0110]MBR1321989.1 helix-turn-helix domain-containing protein [Bradyrhizobium sp. U87765 SZCCT0109]MBR1350733.1 helix-turn-helix domain-